IGVKKAEQIIAYREEHGGFKSIEEIKQVSGIGEKRFEALKDKVTV
ncbi:MAG: ComEA family DNA-binding protein, partial [Leuconostoc mesenteroides]